jgi:uncharacterized protein
VSLDSALYVGRVTHHRLRPRRHRLAYRTYWFLLDLDDMPALARRLRLFAYNRYNLFSLHDEDHGSGADVPLRTQIEDHLASGGIDVDGGRILLLAMPRLLGYAFNPLSVYFCYGRDGALSALVYEVHNTFQERHSYVIAVDGGRGAVQQHCAKRFYVSPFLDMDMRYDFSVEAPGDAVRVTVRGSDHDGDIIAATLFGRREPLTDARLLGVFLSHPLLTLKVTIAIHFEALLLWLKGLRLRPRPAAPEPPVTIGRSARRPG